MCVFLISPVPITEPLRSELIDTPVFYNLAPRPIKYRVSVPIPIHGAPATFQRLMDIVLCPHQQYAAADLDDVVIHSEHWEDNLDRLRWVLMEFRRAGLAANPRKCHLALFEAKYLGFRVGRGLIKPQEKKVEAVRAAPRPSTKTQVRAFLGLAGYYRCFIPNFSSLAAPLTDLTRKGQPERVIWSPETEEAFHQIKRALTEEPVLRAPDFGCPFLLQTDVSEAGLGAVLSQVQEGEEHPVLFISRKLTNAERNYATVDERGSGRKVGSPGAAVLPAGPKVHPSNGSTRPFNGWPGLKTPTPG